MTDPNGRPTFEDDELEAAFVALFPNGWAGPDVQAELAPGGWANSPLAAVFHPTAGQVYEESVRVHRNLAGLGRPRPDAPPPPPEPTLESVTAEHQETPVEPARECQELVGWCLWDVFSDNHEVIDADGRRLHLGSHRSAGGFLAKVVNAQGGPRPPARPGMDEWKEKLFPEMPADRPDLSAFVDQMKMEMFGDGGYTYLDFYMGAGTVAGRTDLGPVYELIFRRLKARRLDWVYHFPRLFAVSFRKPKEAGDEPEWAGYDPSAAFEADEAERQREEESAKLREQLDDGYREAVAAAQDQEPPATVKAYRAVYGHLPDGWPPVAED